MGYLVVDGAGLEVERRQHEYELALARLWRDPRITQKSKELVAGYVRDAALGKTLPGRGKKQVSAARLAGIVRQLTPFMVFVGKDLDQVTQVDVESFITALITDVVQTQPHTLFGGKRRAKPRPLKPASKFIIKATIRKFYKWLYGQNRTFPDLVSWIDMDKPRTEIPALTTAEVDALLDRARTPLEHALIQVLFDAGFRLGELLAIRLEHVRFLEVQAGNPDAWCYFLRTPTSKTLPRTVALPMPASTKWLTLWLHDHPSHPRVRPDGLLEADDVTVPLFPFRADALRGIIKRVGREALGKRVHPHLLRHASATYWANRLPQYRLCKRFGWSLTSAMPQQYIDQAGLDEYDTARAYLTTTPPPAPVAQLGAPPVLRMETARSHDTTHLALDDDTHRWDAQTTVAGSLRGGHQQPASTHAAAPGPWPDATSVVHGARPLARPGQTSPRALYPAREPRGPPTSLEWPPDEPPVPA